RRIWDSTPVNGRNDFPLKEAQGRKQQEQIMNSSNIDLKNSIDRSPVLRAFLLIAVALACFALSPIAHAVSPAPDGGYAGGNTAEGDNALFGLTTGLDNTAIGIQALYSNTTGYTNTATGGNALFNNTTGYFNTANGALALESNPTGHENTAIGLEALANNTTASYITAVAGVALLNNT